jgi:hypothetical protein
MSNYIDNKILLNALSHVNVGPNVINRGNPSQEDTLLLEKFSDVHHYSYSGSSLSSLNISTDMVEGGVYEMHFNISGSAGTTDYLL